MSLSVVLAELCASVRRAGLPLSPVEAIEVQRAAVAVGLANKADLRAALRAVAVKDESQRAVFDRAFDAFFAADGRSQGTLLDRLRSQGFAAHELAALDELLSALGAQLEAEGGGGAFAALRAGGGELDHLLAVAGRKAELERMQSSMQAGFYAQRLLDAAAFPRAETGIAALRDRLRDALGARGDALADALASELGSFARLAREHAKNDLARRDALSHENLRRRHLEERPFVELSPDEARRVMDEVRRLAERMKGALAVRRKRQRRGRLDVRRTLRASHRTGGLPFTPVFRRRRRDRPRLVVLCDVSDSVRVAARFLLVLVHAVQEVFARTRTFVFVSDVGETTRLFREHPPERAIALAYGGAVIPVAQNSNAGRALGLFGDGYADALDSRTTVVVLGDARNNQNDPNVAALRAIRRRVARLVWLNPEPQGAWGFGDSAMKLYERECDDALTVHDLESLRTAVDRLVRATTGT